jgi:hypothetical protein
MAVGISQSICLVNLRAAGRPTIGGSEPKQDGKSSNDMGNMHGDEFDFEEEKSKEEGLI